MHLYNQVNQLFIPLTLKESKYNLAIRLSFIIMNLHV